MFVNYLFEKCIESECSKIESFQHLLNVLLVDIENLLKKVEKGPAISILPRARQTLIRRCRELKVKLRTVFKDTIINVIKH